MKFTLREHRFAILIASLFAVLATIYSAITPIFEASDEFLHYPLVQHLASGRPLPVQEPGVRTLWDQEGSQPPLYYALSAGLTFWIDTGDLEDVLWRNPHGKLGIPLDPDNKNIIIHTPAEMWPWSGTVLAVHLIRLFSVALSTASVWLVYQLIYTIWPNRRWIALLAMALTAFNPMFLFITGSVNNDNLSVMLGTWTLLLTVRVINDGVAPRRTALLALVVSLGTLSKVSGVTLVPLVGMSLLIHGWRTGKWQESMMAAVTIALTWLAVAGWWYLRNIRLYGELFGTKTMVQIAGPREAPVTLWQLRREWYGFWVAYWALFGGVSILADQVAYRILAVLSWLAGAGLVWWAFGIIRQKAWHVLLLPGLFVLQIAITFAALISWTLQTYGSQGRLMFPTIGAISGLMALGLLNWLPERWQPAGAGIVALPVVVLAVISPFRYIAPAYATPPTVDVIPDSATPVGLNYDGFEIVAIETSQDAVEWNERVTATVYLRAQQPLIRNASLYLHALGRNVDDDYQLLGKIDTWPGGGALPASFMEPGIIYRDSYSIHLKNPGDLPSMVRISVGAGIFSGDTYTLLTGTLPDSSKQASVTIPDGAIYPAGFAGCSDLTPSPPAVEATIGGFAHLWASSPQPVDDTLPVHLIWDLIGETPIDWTVFVHLVSPTGVIVGQADGLPLHGDYPTSRWLASCQFEDVHIIELPYDLDQGSYTVVVGMYDASDPAFARAPATDLAGAPYPNFAVPVGTLEVGP